MRYVPALDGLRAVAVLVVVAFHADIGVASGGFLGVSLFFTLSGFLITTLLLHEHESTGSVSLRAFYERRARRLLPAAYLCLGLVVAVGVWWSAAQRRDLAGDVLASVLNVANWRFAFSPATYADLLGADPSPVAHFWSLSIEEQIYVVLPILVVVALRRGRVTLVAVTTALLAGAIVATLLTTDRDLIYNGTHTRAGELLIGVLLALAVRWRRSPGDRPWTAGSGVVASIALLGLVGWASIDQAWLYDGGLIAVGVVSAVLIVAVFDGRFPARLLETRPLVAIGRVSYGIYLFHWPVFVLLGPERVGVEGPALLVVQCAVTALLTVASAVVVERPIRTGVALAGTRVLGATLVTVAAVAAGLAVVVSATVATNPVDEVLALGDAEVVRFGGEVDAGAEGVMTPQARTESRTAPAETGVAPPPPVPDAPIGPVLVVGSDSATAVALAGALDTIDVIDDTRPDCPINDPSACLPLADRIAAALAEHRPVSVVVAAGAAEEFVATRAEESVRSPADVERIADAQESTLADLRAVVAVVRDAGGTTVLHSAAGPSAEMYLELTQLALEFVEVPSVTTDTDGLVEQLLSTSDRRRPGAGSTVPPAILVIGDSTSLNLAQALAEGGAGRLSVTWAGSNGCPLVAVEAVRPDPEGPLIEVDCPHYPDKVVPLLEELRPDAVLVMSGSMELAEHRFAGDPSSYDAVSGEFLARRTEVLAELLEVVGPSTPVLVADMPAVTAGWYASLEMLDPGRLDALNRQIVEWDEGDERVERFDYRRVLEEYEAVNGSIRSDGVHPDVEPFVGLARDVLVDQLLEQVDRLTSGRAEPE